jgi:hypothetical protein
VTTEEFTGLPPDDLIVQFRPPEEFTEPEAYGKPGNRARCRAPCSCGPAPAVTRNACRTAPSWAAGCCTWAATRPGAWLRGRPVTRAGRSRDADRARRRAAPELLPQIRVPVPLPPSPHTAEHRDCKRSAVPL